MAAPASANPASTSSALQHRVTNSTSFRDQPPFDYELGLDDSKLYCVEMTEKALLTAFESNGLKRLEPKKGDKFDPHQHQAMMEQPSDEVAGGAVIQTLQPGYELLGRLVRRGEPA